MDVHKAQKERVGGLVALVVALLALTVGAGIVGYMVGNRSSAVTSTSSGSMVGKDGSAPVVIQAGVADPKVEKAYMRNGVSERIMTESRRVKFGDCYRTYLATLPESGEQGAPEEGKISVVFHVAENGEVLSQEVIDNELKKDDIKNCVTEQLTELRFLPPPLGISRYFVYDFWFKKDETVRKEMEERNSRPALELIPTTPTPSSDSSK